MTNREKKYQRGSPGNRLRMVHTLLTLFPHCRSLKERERKPPPLPERLTLQRDGGSCEEPEECDSAEPGPGSSALLLELLWHRWLQDHSPSLKVWRRGSRDRHQFSHLSVNKAAWASSARLDVIQASTFISRSLVLSDHSFCWSSCFSLDHDTPDSRYRCSSSAVWGEGLFHTCSDDSDKLWGGITVPDTGNEFPNVFFWN